MTEKAILELINQLFEIEKKQQQFSYDKIERNISRIRFLIDEAGYVYSNPIGEVYADTRTDCDATILNDQTPMIISEVIKPIVFWKEGDKQLIVQQGRVIIG